MESKPGDQRHEQETGIQLPDQLQEAQVLANVVAGRAATALLALSHRCDRVPDQQTGGAIVLSSNSCRSIARPTCNLRAAFPEKTDAEIERSCAA